MPPVKDPPVRTPVRPQTDELLEQFRRERKRREEERKEDKPSGFGGGSEYGLPPNPKDWDEGRGALIQFLEDLKKILTHVVEKRIVIDPTKLEAPDSLFLANLGDAAARIDEVIKELQEDKTGSKWYWPLKNVGCVGKAIWVKLRDVYDSISNKSLSVVMEIADVILGSISSVFPVLEPVKELKEIAEARVKYGGDKPLIQDLGLSEREPTDYDSKVTSE